MNARYDMSSDVFARIVENDPALEEQVSKLRNLLSKRPVSVPICPNRTCDFIGTSPEHFTWLMEMLGSEDVGKREFPVCPACDVPIEYDEDRDEDDYIECDLCSGRFIADSIEWQDFFYLKIPVTGKSPLMQTGNARVQAHNPILNQELQRYFRIEPWETLREDEYVVKVRQLGKIEQEDILEKLERYGICLIRWEAEPPSHARIESFNQWLGTIRDTQNDFQGLVKPIKPQENVEANTGNSRQRLAPHVDGTQDDDTPGILVFQYEFGATWGGTSTFYDMAAMLSELPKERLEFIVKSLSLSDCATCSKQKKREDGTVWTGKFNGPLIKSVCGDQSISIRIRLDEVLQVKEDCQSALDELRNAIQEWPHCVSYTPQEGDIVVFDNWRILHGREAVGGRHQRIHDRMWIDQLLSKHDGRYLLGVRPLGNDLMAAVTAENSG